MFSGAGIGVEALTAFEHPLAIRRHASLLSLARVAPGLAALVRIVIERVKYADVIYANSQKAFIIAALATFFIKRPLVWRLRDILDVSHFGAGLRHAAVFLANRRAHIVIANSHSTAKAFVNAGGNVKRVVVAYPGLSETAFSAVTTQDIVDTRTEFGGKALIGLFGRLAPWKGQDVFVDALVELPDVTGIIVGGPLFGEDAFEAELRQRITNLGLSRRIRLLGFRNDVPRLMRSMDVIAHCSLAPEPFGRVIVEAMLAGKPVVACNAGGINEIIEHGKTGFLYEPGSSAALASTLRLALGDAEAAATIAAAGQHHARETFTVAAMIAQIERALAQIQVSSPPPMFRRPANN